MKKNKIIVLGAGLVGKPMAMDLAKDDNLIVAIADISDVALKSIPKRYGIKTIQADLSDKKKLRNLICDYDYVINAVPGFMGYQTVKEVIIAGKDVVDIAFFSEEPYDLDELSKLHNVTCITDCGVAPGMSNVLIAYANHYLDKMDEGVIYVGGLPKKRELPFEYKAVFSPIDVIEEYTRPARIIEHNKLVVRPALSEAELINFPIVGTLEAFNSDGLRSLATTIKVPFLKEKTLRYPGHIDKMKLLREIGFFDLNETEVKGNTIRPIDLTAKLLFPKWKLKDDEIDFTLMQVSAVGEKDGKKTEISFFLYDEKDVETGIHSMARTTGYTATIVLRMIINGMITKKGLLLPEFLGNSEDNMKFLFDEFNKRGINYKKKIVIDK